MPLTRLLEIIDVGIQTFSFDWSPRYVWRYKSCSGINFILAPPGSVEENDWSMEASNFLC